MANLEGGDFGKFTVLNNKDVEKYITIGGKIELKALCEVISNGRKLDGKKDNAYLVINTDEPYVDEIIEILKRNGHWG